MPLVVDCGANVRLSAVWFAERFAAAVIVAVEPEPGNFTILAHTARNYPAIRPLRAAISSKPGRATLSNSGDTPWAWTTNEGDGETLITTIPEIASTDPSYALLVVKADIEGFETTLLSVDTEWTDNLPLLMFEIHDWMQPWSGSGHAFFATLARVKRDYLTRGENVFAYAHSLADRPGN